MEKRYLRAYSLTELIVTMENYGNRLVGLIPWEDGMHCDVLLVDEMGLRVEHQLYRLIDKFPTVSKIETGSATTKYKKELVSLYRRIHINLQNICAEHIKHYKKSVLGKRTKGLISHCSTERKFLIDMLRYNEGEIVWSILADKFEDSIIDRQKYVNNKNENGACTLKGLLDVYLSSEANIFIDFYDDKEHIGTLPITTLDFDFHVVDGKCRIIRVENNCVTFEDMYVAEVLSTTTLRSLEERLRSSQNERLRGFFLMNLITYTPYLFYADYALNIKKACEHCKEERKKILKFLNKKIDWLEITQRDIMDHIDHGGVHVSFTIDTILISRPNSEVFPRTIRVEIPVYWGGFHEKDELIELIRRQKDKLFDYIKSMVMKRWKDRSYEHVAPLTGYKVSDFVLRDDYFIQVTFKKK